MIGALVQICIAPNVALLLILAASSAGNAAQHYESLFRWYLHAPKVRVQTRQLVKSPIILRRCSLTISTQKPQRDTLTTARPRLGITVSEVITAVTPL
jgi:hypothetical protein